MDERSEMHPIEQRWLARAEPLRLLQWPSSMHHAGTTADADAGPFLAPVHFYELGGRLHAASRSPARDAAAARVGGSL